MPKRTWIKIGQVRTLATDRIGVASVEEMDLVLDGLLELVGP